MSVHRMPFGAEVQPDGSVRFRLWAPSHPTVSLLLDKGSGGAAGAAGADATPGDDEPLAMTAVNDGWHELVTDKASPGSRYRFVLPDGAKVPDPASRHQPDDVHGPSEVIDPAAFAWSDKGWRGRPLAETVVYELHIGAFTPAGTFRAAIDKLDHLVKLGVTAIEVMPVSDFPGERNWGYDGVLPYAPDGSYGRPEDFKALVDAAHARGVMVLLDVVYNHFGPEGAYLHSIAPQAFTDRHKTPWGAAINTDGQHSGPVREFFIHNALYWIEEFHLDGLRLDAVHAILDDGPRHLLDELAERVRAAAGDRQVHLFLENEENQASRLVRGPDGRPRWYTAQWNDDVHHVLHVAASGESAGYYGDYHGDTDKLGRALAEGFAFQGELMPYRGHERGEPSGALPPGAFVAFMQNHDQVGNRAFGDRLTDFAPTEAVRAVAATYLLLPQIPMLFMGEEWAAAQPFPFFCDFGPDLADAVRNGRREEFARFPEFQDPANRERIPDPMSKATFKSAKLGWDDLSREPHAEWLAWYRKILAVRHAEIAPRLPSITAGGRYEVVGDGAVMVRWRLADNDGTAAGAGNDAARDDWLVLTANLSAMPVSGFAPTGGRELWREGTVSQGGEDSGDGGDVTMGPWSVRWSLACDSDLQRLADRMGIESSFKDALGKMKKTGDDTRRKLLAAMGTEAADDAQAREVLEALVRAEWLRPLAPVQVHHAGAALQVPVVLPAGAGEITWRLILEDGGEHWGTVAFQSLSPMGERTFDGQCLQRRSLPLGALLAQDLPLGYHRVVVEPGSGSMSLVVSPGACWLPAGVDDGRRLWGIAAQLYLLRSVGDWGIGDYSDLRRLVKWSAEQGADVIGLNPLHAMFLDAPEQASPYSPASRLLLNVLNIDVTIVPEMKDCAPARELIAKETFQRTLAACRAETLVNYTSVAALKLPVLELLFQAFNSAEDPARRQAFDTFRREGGETLARHCLFFALREHFASQDPPLPDWHDWPEEFRTPTSNAAARFARERQERVDFMAWLQWVADEQLGDAAAAADKGDMAVGLYRDLAVGADRSGAETWADAAAVVSSAQVGAPPDLHNPAGQDWGLPPFHPRALREEAYRSFIDVVRANMRHAGGLRIDHVMGLQRLYWVPRGGSPRDGAYVRYPIEELVGILALESHRQGCLVVGEDLGTVPEGFRERMAKANILSYRVMSFEREEVPDGEASGFLPPEVYPTLAVAVAGSHDLPTMHGWWQGRDLDLKERLGLFGKGDEAAKQRKMRTDDSDLLLKALRGEGLLAGGGDSDIDIEALNQAVHAFLARTPAVLAMVQIDDLTNEVDPVNIPATSDEHPNWRRKLSLTLEELAYAAESAPILREFQAVRQAAR